MKSKVIALSAISASFIALLLTLGAYIEIVDVFTVLVASVFVILPTYYKSYLGSFLCFLVGGVLAFLLSGFNFLSIVFPAYFAFFGVYPIIRCLANEKKFNKILYYALCVIWCVGVFYGLYFFLIFVMQNPFQGLPPFVVDNILIFVGIVGVLVFALYDRCMYIMKKFMDANLGKFIK